MTSEIEFRLPQPSFEDYTWMLFDEHGPSSVPPLLESQGFGFGNDNSSLPRSLRINGFTYMRINWRPDRAGEDGLVAGPWGGQDIDYSVEDLRAWRHEWLPQADEVCDYLESFDPARVSPGTWDQVLASQSNAYMQVFGGIHRTAVGPVRVAGSRFRAAFRERFGRERDADLETLFQGVPNCSLDRAIALWDLSRLLRQDAALALALDRNEALPDTPLAREFEAGLALLLENFGYTSNADLQDQPNWREDRTIPLAAIRAYARVADGRGPREAAESQRERRLAIESELRALALTDTSVARLLPMMEAAQELMPSLEDHNYYADQRMAGASRARWLSIGRFLQSKGALEAEDDVFYLYREELVRTLDGGTTPPRDEIAARKAHLAMCRATIPPAVLGKQIPMDEPLNEGGLQTSETRVLRGIAASPGSYRGRARVIEALTDAASLVEGDILVCRITSPPWTPFFGVISALVTNSGGALSHASVVAREFGLPAVVGTIHATNLIRDGDTLTVDGTNGVVIIES